MTSNSRHSCTANVLVISPVTAALLLLLSVRCALAQPTSPEDAFKTAWNYVVAGERSKAARSYQQIVTDYPNSECAAEAREWATVLAEMAKEDGRWREPADPTAMSIDDRIAYHLYHLRNLRVLPATIPGIAKVLYEGPPGLPDTYNSAVELKRIGMPAVPALIDLLDDRRPTRSLARLPGKWQILRYQDVAIQILRGVFPDQKESFSPWDSPAVRAKVVSSIKNRYQDWLDASQPEPPPKRGSD